LFTSTTPCPHAPFLAQRAGLKVLPATVRLSILAGLTLILIGCGGDRSVTGSPSTVAPAISSQPQDVVVNLGQPATFSVTASGTAPLEHQWRRGAAVIAGATSSSYTIANSTPADHGASFTVSVTNAAGTVTSRDAKLTVNTLPSITTQPQDVVAADGQSIAFSVGASGTSPLGFQWRRNGTDIAGAKATSYVLTATVSDNDAKFSVYVTNVAGGVASRDAILTLVNSPSITAQPQDISVRVGQPATFSVTATGTPAPTFQWQRNGADILDATASSYMTLGTQRADSGDTYSVRVTNQSGAATSRAALLRVTGVTVYGLGGFRPDLNSALTDIVGVRYRFLVTENQSQSLKIMFSFNRVFTPGGSITSFFESNLYSGGVTQSDGICTTWPLGGTYVEGRTSLRLAIADYPFNGGSLPGITTGLRTLSPTAFPTQNYLVDNIPKLYKTDAISQGNFTSIETLVTIERGPVISDVSPYQRCGQSWVSGNYRVWTIRVEPIGQPAYAVELVMSELYGRFLLAAELANMATEFLHTAGYWGVQYWDFATKRESDPTWRPVSTFVTGTLYDGNTRDFGVRVVTIGGQNRVEISNRSGNTYLRGGVKFSY
jgi:hypothetical protein